MKFGHFLRKQREQREWTQPQAAEAIGIEQSYLSKLENNKAVPSSEIFEQLLHVYEFDLKILGEAVDESELEKLQEIVLIRDFIMRSRTQGEKTRRRWLLMGLAMVMVGVFFIGYSFSPLHDRQNHYTYESKAVLNKGENPFMFTEMPSFREYQHVLRDWDGEKCDPAIEVHKTENTENIINNPRAKCFNPKTRLQTHSLFPRLDYHTSKTWQYRGEYYDVPVKVEQTTPSKVSGQEIGTDRFDDTGKFRRYFLIDTHVVRRHDPIVGMLAIGLMLMIGGVASFFISRRW